MLARHGSRSLPPSHAANTSLPQSWTIDRPSQLAPKMRVRSIWRRGKSVIRLNSIALKYGTGHEVLRNVTFHLRPGSFHFLTGPSGSGKTSLLRLLFMSMQATRGQIYVLGQDISHVSPAKRAQLRRRIGIVFQDFRLLDHLTTWENVACRCASPASVSPTTRRM